MQRFEFLKKLMALGAGIGMLPLQPSRDTQHQKIKIYGNYVRGVVYTDGMILMNVMSPGDQLELVREPKNKYDPCAIALTYSGQKIGYVPAEDNAILSRMMDIKAGLFKACIEKIYCDAPSWQAIEFGVYSYSNLNS